MKVKRLGLATMAVCIITGGALAADNWGNSSGDGLWTTDANWLDNSKPTTSSSTYVRSSDLGLTAGQDGSGPTINASGLVARNLSVEVGVANRITTTMTGGTLTLHFPGANNCYFRLGSGTSSGLAIFNMSGGTFVVDVDAGQYSAGANGNVRVGSAYAGQINMSGNAEIQAWDLTIGMGNGSYVDLSDSASIVLTGDESANIDAMIADNRLTSNGRTVGSVEHTYNSGTDRTTITASAPVPIPSSSGLNNPISYVREITDCDVIKYNGEYYIVGNWLGGDMLRSRDLESWGERKHVFSWTNTWHTPSYDPQDLDIAAGHIRYINGTFHFYTQMDLDAITHATSSNIWGPYAEPVDSPFADNIDAETFRDEDGSLHFYCTKFAGGNGNFYRSMSDPYTFSSGYIRQVWTENGSGDWEDGTFINEGPKVFKCRNRYYQLYAAYATTVPEYSIGCVEASSPASFSNSGKYSAPVCTRYTPPGHNEIAYIGQPWVVDGLNGFEKWMGYFAQTTSEGRTQRIDRMHFFDRTLFVDGPTDRWTPGYHPAPAKPQLLNIFSMADGALPSNDWNPQAGTWSVASEEALQSDQNVRAFNPVSRAEAVNYLIEANLKFTASQDGEDKAGILAYYQDADNYVIAGLNRVLDDWYVHVREGGVNTIYSGGNGGSVNYGVYHKIRVTKNGGTFDVRLDETIPSGFTPVVTGFGAGRPGLYTDHAATAFDGVIYTIGWDEFDSGITGWGANPGGVPEIGSWSVGADGITMAAGTGYTFKGDLMDEYEFATQVYKAGAASGKMGVVAVAIDLDNYMIASITNAQLVVEGIQGGSGFAEAPVSVTGKDDYNLRVVKLNDRVIFFVDGEETLTVNRAYGAAQVGLFVDGMSARFNGIMVYRTEPDAALYLWSQADVGLVGFAGNADLCDGALHMTGSGGDIWGTADSFAFTHKDLSGDWEISTRIVNLDESDYSAKSGLIFRDSLIANSPMVAVVALPGDAGDVYDQPDRAPRVSLLWRDTAGGSAHATDVLHMSFPMWVKLRRVGSVYTGYYSSDGQSWTEIGQRTIAALPATGKMGFGVCSHNNQRIVTSVFDHVEGITLRDIPTYSRWSVGNGLTGENVAMDADPDCDGLNNLAEYALGGNPNSDDVAAVLPDYEVVAVGASNAVDYIYRRRLDPAVLGLTYGLNTSTNLTGAWDYAGTTYETGSADIDQDFESVSNSVPFETGSGFVHLKITEQ